MATSNSQRPRRLGAIDARRWSAHHPVVVDLGIATMVAGAALIFEATDAAEVGATLDIVDIVACVIAIGLIVLRRTAPIPVLAVAVAAGVWSLIPDDDQGVLRVATCLALYTVASRSTRTVAWTACASTATALFLTATMTTAGPWYDGDSLELIAWTAAATAIGDAVRSRRAVVVAREDRATALRERAERAEQALDEEARRQVVEERLRIARELHDVVAHHIAVINVQAGVATHLVRTDPAGAEEALEHVRRGASSVLDELSSVLSVMRHPDDLDSSKEPLPTLNQLDRLIAELTGTGLQVEWHTTGTPQHLTPAVSLAAYRIIQESLTNARRHGNDLHVSLSLRHQADALIIDLTNTAAGGHTATGRRGHGIIGMQERVVAAGGTIDIGPTADGRFRVHVTLPVAEGAR